MSSNISSSTNKQYWLSQSIFWGVFALINLSYSLLWPPFKAVNITVSVLAASVMLASSHSLRTLYKKYASKWSIYSSIACALLLIPLAGFIAQAIVFALIQLLLLVAPATLDGMVPYSWRNYILYGMNSTMTLALWSIVYLVVVQFRGRRQSEAAYWKSQAQLRDNELQFLHNQINSHFLFNAMNNLRALILENPELARERLTQLANILRATMGAGDSELVSLSDELTVVKAYLDLEALQYEDRMTVEFQIEPQIQSCQLPPMLLQTLVENAVRHGIAHSPSGGTIHIEGVKDGQQAKIIIQNPSPQLVNNKGQGVGLKNTRTRLEKSFGGRATLDTSQLDGSYVATLLLPL